MSLFCPASIWRLAAPAREITYEIGSMTVHRETFALHLPKFAPKPNKTRKTDGRESDGGRFMEHRKAGEPNRGPAG
jgi:hypothetical protein